MSEHSEKVVMQETWARMNALSSTYYDIAHDAYDSFLAEEENLLPIPGENDDPTEVLDQERRVLVAGIKTIVFSSMCIEAAAFDFAASQLGDDYVEKYLDKLDIIAKWVVVPKLISGRTLKEDGPALNGLRILVRSRNGLVHHKSLPYDSDPEGKKIAAAEKASKVFPTNVHNAFKTLILLSLELNELLGVSSVGLPPFEKHVISLPGPSKRIKKVIERCRVIHNRRSNQEAQVDSQGTRVLRSREK